MSKKKSEFLELTLPEFFDYLEKFKHELFLLATDAEKMLRYRDYEAVEKRLKRIREML